MSIHVLENGRSSVQMLAAKLLEDEEQIEQAIVFYTTKDDHKDVGHRLRVFSTLTSDGGVHRGFLTWAAALFLKWAAEE